MPNGKLHADASSVFSPASATTGAMLRRGIARRIPALPGLITRK
jgi:hypothetical protein